MEYTITRSIPQQESLLSKLAYLLSITSSWRSVIGIFSAKIKNYSFHIYAY